MFETAKQASIFEAQQKQIDILSEKVDKLGDIILASLCKDYMFLTSVEKSWTITARNREFGPFTTYRAATEMASYFFDHDEWTITSTTILR